MLLADVTKSRSGRHLLSGALYYSDTKGGMKWSGSTKYKLQYRYHERPMRVPCERMAMG